MHLDMRAILLLITVNLAVVESRLTYSIVPRRQVADSNSNRYPTQAPVISFDGDLERIKQLALDKAEGQDNAPSTQGPNSYPTASPLPAATPASCNGASKDNVATFQWKYSLETFSSATLNVTIGKVQKVLQGDIADMLLTCRNASAAIGGIVAMDTLLPFDRESADTVCAPEVNQDNVCTAVDGYITLYLASSDSATDAFGLTATAVKAAIAESDFVSTVGAGLVKITYIEDAASTSGSSGENDTPRGEVNSASTLGTAPMLMVTVGSAALVVFVASVYYYRRTKDNDGEGAATQLAGSTVLDATIAGVRDEDDDKDRPSSPFSEMLPSAYRFNENMSILSGQGMSAIMEDESSHTGSIVVSESGYTTEAGEESSVSFDIPNTLYTRVTDSPEVLGARKRESNGITAAAEITISSDSSEVDSSVESPARVLHGGDQPSTNVTTTLLNTPPHLNDSLQAEQSLLFLEEESADDIKL